MLWVSIRARDRHRMAETPTGGSGRNAIALSCDGGRVDPVMRFVTPNCGQMGLADKSNRRSRCRLNGANPFNQRRTAMKYYCGLDVSLNSTAACVVNHDGTIIREGEVPSEPAAIDQWLKAIGLPMERVGLEAGGLSSWLCKELIALGLPVICIETRHAKAAMKAQQVKTDRNDARGLAHMMRTGWYKEVHIKSRDSQELRMLLKNRRCLLDKRRDIESQIRGSLRTFGLKLGKVAPAKYEQRIRELISDNERFQVCISPMLEVRRVLIEQCKKLEKQIGRAS